MRHETASHPKESPSLNGRNNETQGNGLAIDPAFAGYPAASTA
jgi:hypothetical protein